MEKQKKKHKEILQTNVIVANIPSELLTNTPTKWRYNPFKTGHKLWATFDIKFPIFPVMICLFVNGLL